jgi:dimethylhistidine N-methyltransferase
MGKTATLGVEGRLRVVHVAGGKSPNLHEAVITGLSQPQKSIPSRFFYDETGSELFEQITDLPEYYLTRSEQSIFERSANSIVAFAGEPITIVEFGSGSSKKTRLLIEAALEGQSDLEYVSVDISEEYLTGTAKALLERYPNLRVVAVAAEYFDSIDSIPIGDRPRLFLFLGSNIGNLDDKEAGEFFARIRESMGEKDRILVGMDLAKSSNIIEPAYNDSLGVTAQFNKNLLRRINHQLGADFDIDAFRHRAPYLIDKGRIEMWLVSERNQEVKLPGHDKPFVFEEGEILHTENSRKYTYADAARLATSANLCIEHRWQDENRWFSLFLLAPV